MRSEWRVTPPVALTSQVQFYIRAANHARCVTLRHTGRGLARFFMQHRGLIMQTYSMTPMLIKICQSLFRAGRWRYSRSCRMKRKKSGSITGRCRTGRVTEKPFRTVEWLKTPDSKRVADSHFGASLPTPATRVKYSRQLARCHSDVTDKPIRRADRPRRKRSRAGRVHGRICRSGVDAKSGLRRLAAPGRVKGAASSVSD
jgi:hypothetical protein